MMSHKVVGGVERKTAMTGAAAAFSLLSTGGKPSVGFIAAVRASMACLMRIICSDLHVPNAVGLDCEL